MWECDLKVFEEHDEEFKKYVELHKPSESLKPRDALFGGRTNALKLFHKR
jgi:hypothetical protein